MTCKYCGKEIPKESIYCMWCGEKLKRSRREKEKEISVPKPRQLPSGSYFAQVMKDGKRTSITAPTEKEYYAKARAFLSELIEIEKADKKLTLKTALTQYIEKRTNVCSPSTIRGYNTIMNCRFQNYMVKEIHTIDYQRMINDEILSGVSPKTIKTSWLLCVSALNEADIHDIKVKLPQIPKSDEAWLDRQQIDIFVDAIRGRTVELPALLALHGLRRSELLAVTKDKVVDGKIHVSGSIVKGPDGNFVEKKTNKNSSSDRWVPIFIPRLQELIDAAPEGHLVTMAPNSIYSRILTVCDKAGLPQVGVHGLRRSFCSLCYSLKLSEMETMRLGGWSDYATMRSIYTKLSEKDFGSAVDTLKAQFTNKP